MFAEIVSMLAQVMTPTSPSAPATMQMVFVAPGGADNGAGSRDNPLSLAAAVRLANAPHSSTTLTLLAGVYAPDRTIKFDCRDCTVVVQAAVKGAAVITGRRQVDIGMAMTGRAVTVTGLTMRDFTNSGIRLNAVGSATITDNEIYDIRSTAWNQAGIVGLNFVDNVVVQRNFVHDTGYAGILFSSSPTGALRNVHIIGNILQTTCQTMSDCGAIYVGGRSDGTVGTVIANNHIHDFARPGLQGKGIYLDDGLSNAVVRSNVIGGTGDYAIQIHNGHGNTISMNTIDATGSKQPILFQWSPAFDKGPMAKNAFSNNSVTLRPEHQGSMVRYIQANGAVELKDNKLQVR